MLSLTSFICNGHVLTVVTYPLAFVDGRLWQVRSCGVAVCWRNFSALWLRHRRGWTSSYPRDLDRQYCHKCAGILLAVSFSYVNSCCRDCWLYGMCILTHSLIATELDRSSQWVLAAGAAGVSIAAKEALFRATVKIGQQANSKVLIANAWHHRTDAISSVVALGGIIGSMAGVPFLDPGALCLVRTKTISMHCTLTSFTGCCEQLPVWQSQR